MLLRVLFLFFVFHAVCNCPFRRTLCTLHGVIPDLSLFVTTACTFLVFCIFFVFCSAIYAYLYNRNRRSNGNNGSRYNNSSTVSNESLDGILQGNMSGNNTNPLSGGSNVEVGTFRGSDILSDT